MHKSVIIRYEKTIRLFLRFPGGINGSTKDKEPLIQKFCGEIQYHIDGRYQVFVPQQAGCQEIAQQGGKGGKDPVVGRNLCHGHGHVGRGLEGELPVQGEIPQHAQNKGDQVAGPVGKGRKLIEQGKGCQFNQPGTDGKKGEFENPDPFFHGKPPPQKAAPASRGRPNCQKASQSSLRQQRKEFKSHIYNISATV